MLFRIFLILILILSVSCSTVKKTEGVEKSLAAIKVIGEGRGRLGIEPQNYLFSFDAVLKDKKDWILAVMVPLHGEEVMILHDLRNAKPPVTTLESFEERIEHELRNRKKLGNLKSGEFVIHIRSMIRFILARELGLDRACQGEVCRLDSENYQVLLSEKNISVKKEISVDYTLELIAENLTDSFFNRTNFYLRDGKDDSKKSPPVLSLELFWK